MSGVYVHVPWCRAVCPYCGFAVVRDDGRVPWSAYVDRVLLEREQRREALPDRPQTVFLGGGTPSRMPPAELGRLIRGLDPVDGAEISAEVNPEDAVGDWLRGALEAGVTRISIGVQTLDGRHSRLLGRGHTSPQAHAVMERVASMGFSSWSADLIFALPGQTLAELEADLGALLELDPPHVALYGLTYEEGTPFEARRRAGKLKPLPDDDWRAMYDLLVDRLEGAGLLRYEVSNFARAGHRSRHNEGYWVGRPYLGLGPAAHGFAVDGHRWINLADPAAWLTAADPTLDREHPVGIDAAIDRLVSGLRHVDGVDLDALIARTDHGPDPAAIERATRGGLLSQNGPRIALTRAGFPVADAVIGSLVTALRPMQASAGPARTDGKR